MGLLNRIFGREQRDGTSTSDPYLAEYFASRGTGSGVSVNANLIENLSVVFACVQVISETVAMLPLHVYRKSADGSRVEASSHPVAQIFGGDANDYQTATEFLETMVAHCLLRGNAYAEIIRNNRGAPTALIPIHPDNVAVVRLIGSGSYAYDVTLPSRGTRRLLPDEVLHLKDRSDDGIVGKSRLYRARETFSTAMATENYAAATFKNGASLSGVLSHPKTIGDEAIKNLSASFANSFKGSENAGKVAILEEGLKWQAVSVSPDDAQMLESRKFGVENLARIFRVPPPVLGDFQGGNYSSISEVGRWFYSHTIQPWLNRIERTVERALFSQQGRRNFELEFDCDVLLRGDMLTRFQAYRIGREVGIYNANELRKFEKANPRTDPGGDEYFAPANMVQEQTGRPVADRNGGQQ